MAQLGENIPRSQINQGITPLDAVSNIQAPDIPLPDNNTINMNHEMAMPYGMSMPQGMPMPQGMSMPQGMPMPQGMSMPQINQNLNDNIINNLPSNYSGS